MLCNSIEVKPYRIGKGASGALAVRERQDAASAIAIATQGGVGIVRRSAQAN